MPAKRCGLKSDKDMRRNLQKGDRNARLATFLCLSVATLSSCHTVRYVPLEQVRTEYRHIADTVRETDSIIHERETVIREADSAMVAELGLKLRDNERAILILRRELERKLREARERTSDTIIVKDTVNAPYPVEKNLTWWQGTCIEWFPWTIAAATFLLIIIIKPWRWLKKN